MTVLVKDWGISFSRCRFRGHSQSTFFVKSDWGPKKANENVQGARVVKPICTFALRKKLPGFSNSKKTFI